MKQSIVPRTDDRSRVLLVDDDKAFVDGLAMAFEDEGYRVRVVNDGARALHELGESRFACVIADVNMPRVDGFTLCRKLRESGDDTPLILLTSRDGEIDEALGLELGADDYISKPFSLRVLFARVEAVQRRRTPKVGSEVVVRGRLALDPERFDAVYGGVSLTVTVTEFKLLEALSRRPGIVLSRERLLALVRDDDTTVAPRIVDTYIARLRKKLQAIDASSDEIETLVGAGYRWRDGA